MKSKHLILMVVLLVLNQVKGSPPPQRDELSLNGTWSNGTVVPCYAGNQLPEQTCERMVEVPSTWSGKLVRVEFEAVNYSADVFIDGQLAARHVGAWLPFAVDVPSRIKPGQRFALKVVVKGMLSPPIVDTNGLAQWPVGSSQLKNKQAGIVGDVWLRAYGPIYIEDAFIQPSVKNKKLVVDYTIVNTGHEARAFTLTADVRLAGQPDKVKTVTISALTIGADETKQVHLETEWENPDLWWPDHPVLYHLQTQLSANDKVVDQETRRFGFREIGINGNQFTLNGTRINLWGDYAVYGEKTYWPEESYAPENISKTFDALKSLNVRILRWHETPSPRYTLEAADEKGLLLVAESAVEHLSAINREFFVGNCEEWVKGWVRANRNHPSIFLWSAENAMGPDCFKVLSKGDILAIGRTIHSVDPTRPVTYDGDNDVGDAVVSYHNLGKPVGSIYSWRDKLVPAKPTGASELLATLPYWHYPTNVVEDNKWWQGIWIRGLRYVGFTDIRPAVYGWASKESSSSRAQLLRNAYAPIALFDKEYDDLGIAPFTTGHWPMLEAGARQQRSLVLYNDDFSDPHINVQITVVAANRICAKGALDVNLSLGEHVDIPYFFQVPYGMDGDLEVILQTKKQGVFTFEEKKSFSVKNNGQTGDGSDVVSFGEANLPANGLQPLSVKLSQSIGPLVPIRRVTKND